MLRRSWTLGLLLFAGFAVTARAAEAPASPPLAIFIGIDKYQDPQIKPRKHAEADAKALYDLFVSKEHLGVTKDNVKLLLGSADGSGIAEKATRANILKALSWLGKNAKKDTHVVLAYIGQGAPIGERSGYFAVDSTFKGRAKDAVASGDIQQIVEKLPSRRFVALIDVNFLGFDAGKETPPDPNLQNFYREFFNADESTKTPAPSRTIFLANTGLKPSIDLERHGIFTKVLLDGLDGKADVEGYEPDGNITVGELVKYVRKELPALARAKGKNDDEKGQTPIIFELQKTDFIIDFNPAVHPQSVKRLARFDELARTKNLPKELAEEGHNLLERMPKLEAKQELRKAYQKLADGTIDVAALTARRKEVLESTVMSEREAATFAITVLRAARVVRQSYYKDVHQSELVGQAIDGIFDGAHEKMPSALKERVGKVKEMKDADLVKLLTEARQALGKREDLAKGKDVTLSLHSMLRKLDKHTGYIDPEIVQRMQSDIEGSFTGIGVQIRKNNIRDQLQVVTPIIGSPAYKAGLKANDIITTIVREVDSLGKPLAKPETLPTKGMTTEEAVKKILGKQGTKVRLIVDRAGSKEPLEFNLIRGRVEVESVMGVKRNADDTWNYVVDPENKICYVRLTQFSHNSYRDLEKVMRKLYKVGIKGFVLDLRFNPGGLLDSAVKISDLFIDDGLIVTIRPRNGPETSYVGKSDGSYTAFPMVCLINGGSASASEIVSACLQDHGRALIVGTRSYGKGSVQTIHSFLTGGKLKLTTATFWRPNGRNLNRASTKGRDEDVWGVTPDGKYSIKIGTKELNDLQDHMRDTEIIRDPTAVKTGTPGNGKTEFHDRQLDAALEYLRGQIRTASKAGTKKAG